MCLFIFFLSLEFVSVSKLIRESPLLEPESWHPALAAIIQSLIGRTEIPFIYAIGINMTICIKKVHFMVVPIKRRDTKCRAND
jgi:hypothetical protein